MRSIRASFDPGRRLTCSLGAVCCRIDGPAPMPESLFAAADELMYTAKRSGKDRACFSAPGLADLRRNFEGAHTSDERAT